MKHRSADVELQTKSCIIIIGVKDNWMIYNLLTKVRIFGGCCTPDIQ